MPALVQLSPSDTPVDHPCADPALYEPDQQLLAYMLQDLRALVRRMLTEKLELKPYETRTWSVHDLQRRTVVCNPAGLAASTDVRIVGFFGERRGDSDTQGRIDQLERELLTQFRDFPGVLSYSSIELVDDYRANLLVHVDDGDREAWRNGRVHREAAEDASPGHYRSVRIHHGLLHGGVSSSNMIRLLRTKYWDYGEVSSGAPEWTTMRELDD